MIMREKNLKKKLSTQIRIVIVAKIIVYLNCSDSLIVTPIVRVTQTIVMMTMIALTQINKHMH